MAGQMTQSNQDIFYNPTVDDSGGGEPLVNLTVFPGHQILWEPISHRILSRWMNRYRD